MADHAWGTLIFIIVISTIITERLLEGLHRFYWLRKLKIYLVGEGKPHLVGEYINRGIVQIAWIREYIRCKFCQSWATAWVVSFIVLWIFWGISFHFIWIGLVAGSLANKLHDLGDAVKAIKLLPYTVFHDSDDPAKRG